jgi:hypothetical protein
MRTDGPTDGQTDMTKLIVLFEILRTHLKIVCVYTVITDWQCLFVFIVIHVIMSIQQPSVVSVQSE